LATDFSKPAQRAFQYAMRLADTLAVRLVVLHVVKAIAGTGRRKPIGSRYVDVLRTEAMVDLGRLARVALDVGIPTEPRLVFGSPASRILEVTHEMRAGLIVLGTSGRTGWDRLRVGSTAEEVVRKAPCGVLTMRETIAGDSVGVRTAGGLRRLLVATDFSVHAQAAIDAAVMLSTRLRAELFLLYAGSSDDAHAAMKSELPFDSRVRLQEAASSLRSRGLAAHDLYMTGDPVEVILEQAARYAVDGIVIGTRGLRGLQRLMLGSVAEQVVKRAGCPVLTVKNPLSRDTVATMSISNEGER
jgi:nucleotide-binding universal stress UspA family protein